MSRLKSILTLTLLAIALCGCRHKCFHSSDEFERVLVNFDLTECPDANPSGMALIFFPVDGGSPWRFDFQGTASDYVEAVSYTHLTLPTTTRV